MKAIVRSKYGSPEVLSIREVEKPTPKDNEVLVRVHAATVNRTDCGILWGKPFLIRFFTGLFKPTSPVPGTDFAGIVEQTGKNVRVFKPGDRVWGFNDEGLATHAEYITIAEDQAIAPVHDSLTFEQAAACAEGAHYALNFINKVHLEKGHHVLVNGATGAIGSAAVQLLKYIGAEVTAVCNTKNVALVKTLGADRVIDYEKEDFTKEAVRYHFIFDAVGKSSFGKCKPLLHPRGIYISSELGPRSENPFLALITPLFGGRKVIFPIPVNCRRSILYINRLVSEGKFKPVIDRVCRMEEIADAYRYVASGQKTGNVIVKFA